MCTQQLESVQRFLHMSRVAFYQFVGTKYLCLRKLYQREIVDFVSGGWQMETLQ